MAWTCLSCAARNKPRAVECENCGAERTERPAGRERSAVDLRCAWSSIIDGQDRHCLMNVDGRPTVGLGPGYCMWHDRCRTHEDARYATNWEAFLEWWTGWYGTAAAVPYCGEPTHHPPEHLFQKLCGEAPAVRVADPCRVKSCPHALVGPLKTPVEAMAVIRRVLTEPTPA